MSKHPNPIHFTSQLGSGSREARNWGTILSSNLRAWVVVQVEGKWPSLAFNQTAPKKQPRPLIAAHSRKAPPTYYNPHSQPRKYSGPAHTMQPCIRAGTATRVKRHELGPCLSRASDSYTGHTRELCKHTSPLTSALSSLAANAFSVGEGKIPKSPRAKSSPASKLLLQQLESRPCHDRAAGDCASAERKSQLTPSRGCRSFNTSHKHHQSDSRQHTLRENLPGVHVTSGLTLKTLTHTVYMEMLLH